MTAGAASTPNSIVTSIATSSEEGGGAARPADHPVLRQLQARYGRGLVASSWTYFATITISGALSLPLNDFMSSPFPLVRIVTIESSVCFAMKAESNVAILGYRSRIDFVGVPRTPWHFLQLLSYRSFGVLACPARRLAIRGRTTRSASKGRAFMVIPLS